MHKDYAIEVYNSLKNPKYVESASDLAILKALCTDEIVDFAKDLGDEKISSICSTMQESFGYKNNSCKIRKRITEKQRFAVSDFLLNKFESAKKVICLVFGITEDQFTEK